MSESDQKTQVMFLRVVFRPFGKPPEKHNNYNSKINIG